MNLSITCLIFKLEVWNFRWKYILTDHSQIATKTNKMGPKDKMVAKIEHNSLNYEARSTKLCMQVDFDRPQKFTE